MIASIDVSSLSAAAQRLVQPTAPLKVQELAGRGVAPGIKPGEMIAVLLVLQASDRPTVKAAAEQTIKEPPPALLAGALGADLPPAVIDALVKAHAERIDVLEKLLGMATISMETVENLAKGAVEAVCELIATNEERLLACPRIIELLYLNKHTRMSTADRLVDLAVRGGIELTGIGAWREVAQAIKDELIAEPATEPTPDDVLFRETGELADRLASAEDEDTYAETNEGKEVLKDRYVPLYRRIADMTVSQKIRRAILGSKEERMLLVRDSNRMVQVAAARSPLLNESEVALISRNRNISEEVLRVIGSTPELVKSYVVKRNLVENPKTPVMIATRMVGHMRESDLKQIAKSKNITGPVQDAARRHLDRRKT